jgi:hypothetical protein
MRTRNSCLRGVFLSAVGACVLVGAATARADDPNDPPVITQHPTDQTVCEDDDVTFTIVATGQELSYQWRKDDQPIGGATSDTLLLDAVTVDDSGDYDCVVTNPYGQATSDAATLIVDPGPVIIEQPAGQEVCEGESVTLSVAVGNQATTYEDTVGSVASSGSGARLRGNYYRIDAGTTLTRIEHYLNVSAAGTLVFFVYEADNLSGPYALIAQDVVDSGGTGLDYYASNPLAVPLVTGRYYIIGAGWPDDHTYYWDSSHPNTISFGASLNGFAYSYQDPMPDPPPTNTNGFAYMQRLTTSDLALTYQWRKNDEDIPGASGPEYTISSMSATDAADYQVLLANDCGSTLSQTATLTLGEGVTITQDPNDQSICVGGSATFSVVAEGPDLGYQWRKNGEDIADATTDCYIVEEATLDDAGDYDVLVTNACDTATSVAATLLVAAAGPTVTEHPADQLACAGDPVVLTVVAEGIGLQYQWRKGGEDIADATSDSYTIGVVDPNDCAVYDVIVSNPCGSVVSEPAALTVEEPVSVIQQPAGDSICAGDQYTFAVVAGGTNISYQWRKEAEDIPEATADTYVISAATLDDSGDYDVVVSNFCGELVSDIATLTVVAGPVIADQPAGRRLREGQPLTLSVTLDPASFPDDVDAIGELSESSTGPRIRANCYLVRQTATLRRIEQYLGISTPGALVFFVYQAEAEEGPYTLIVEDTVAEAETGTGFHASNPLELTLSAGKYYIVGAAWPDAHTYYWGGVHPQPTAFGESVCGYAASYQSPLPNSPVPSSAFVYSQRLTTVQTEASYEWRKDGVLIVTATTGTYEIAAVTLADAGLYEVAVTNVCGTVLSDPARVVVLPGLTPAGSTYLETVQEPVGADPNTPPP